MFKTYYIIIGAISFILGVSCSDQHFNLNDRFNMEHPEATIPLSRQLTKLAGVSIDTSRTIWAINDSSPTIFSIDAFAKQTTNQITIAKDNDYRGITYHDGYTYVARNDGFIKRIAVETNKSVATYFNPIQKIKEIGGMCFSKSRNQLLLVNSASDDATQMDVYSFDLESKKFNEEVTLSVSISDLRRSLQELKAPPISIHPTGLAEDPLNGDLYFTFDNQCIVVTNNSGTIKTAVNIPQNTNGSMGGICFNKDGNLLIGYQKKDAAATIYNFKRK